MSRMISIPFFLLFFPVLAQSQASQFVFNGFNNGGEANLTLREASIIKPTGLLRLTNRSNHIIGHAFYNKPIKMLKPNSSSPNQTTSFSTHFVFAIVSPSSGRGGYGLAFTISPKMEFPGAASEHYLGVSSPENDGDENNHIFAVEFDTVNGINEELDSMGNHVGINENGMNSTHAEPAAYIRPGSKSNKEDVHLESGEPIKAWIEYDSITKFVNVTIAPLSVPRPNEPLLSTQIDLSSVLIDEMYVGFSSSTGKKASSHYILGWSFSNSGTAPPLNYSLLPNPPKDPPSSKTPGTKILIGVLSAVIVTLLVILFCLSSYKRMLPFERLEDWELDCPHRFHYKDLYKATNGFKDSQVIGVGGFGAVYKGVLPSTGCEVAVKRITRSRGEGVKEFAAEIESLGRLRHKNLVNLQGWCKKKNNLLIVYDYIPNGSLDSLIFHPKNDFVLRWGQRFNILKGVASGLLYLHEEWEQVVIHRDVKSSNVLIDSEMNPRLGDFGLARLYDHGEISHTTGVVGTIGYIAPELARLGKASTSTDVFAYGALLLEVATGRRPIGSGQFVLVDWVMECYNAGRILSVVDPLLGLDYDVEEMELVLKLGLLCSQYKPEARPGMRQVIRLLNGEDPVPVLDSWSLFDSQRLGELNSRFMKAISSDKVASYRSSSLGVISFTSIDAGR
ncbi:hypothetical protein UlMin_000939 [Ulmus minor]